MSYTLFLILIFIVAILLILVIMVQNPKGGGLSSSFGGGQNMGGVQNTNDFLDKSTWTLATVLFALILLSNFAIPRTNSVDTRSETEGIINERDANLDAPATLDTNTELDTTQ
ncbi:preprotein translocase subunit SecG [Namhaeicola litoreus]|uniref:Protein-export membrane protein SecG n=1 Tax=Namhaeicola litoreus TaxID=1052145 RepID=A0ABW3Y123_9FLAO